MRTGGLSEAKKAARDFIDNNKLTEDSEDKAESVIEEGEEE